MIEQIEVTVPAPGGEQKRSAFVYLPKAYNGKKRFPVLYMFDGQTAFYDETAPYGDSWRMGEILDGLNAELIVAAVECDKENRLTEYSPFPFTSPFGSSGGKGAVYMDWLVQTFKPAIDESYFTLPAREHTYILGSSMGGLMTLFALCRYPGVFGGGAALSPSLWIDPEACAEMITAAEWKKRPTLYLDYGAQELKNHGNRQRHGLTACFGALMEKNAAFTFRLIEGGTHSEKSWREQIPVFLKFLHLI